MVERREIELLPEEIEAARKHEKGLRTYRLIGLGILGLAILVLVLLLSLIGGQALLVNNVRRLISEKEAQIGELATTEEKIVGLADKNAALTQIFSARSYYSILLETLRKSVPQGIAITTLSAAQTGEAVNLSGETRSYGDLAKFLKNLVDPKKGGSLFTQVALSSVVLEPTTGKAKFVAEATVVEGGLKKGWETLLK